MTSRIPRSLLLFLALCASAHAQESKEPPSAAVVVQVAKAVNGTDATQPAVATTKPAPGKLPEPAAADKKSAGPSQQPAMASPPKKGEPVVRTVVQPTPQFAPANAAWQQTAQSANFNPLSNVRLLSPLCPGNTEATSCSSFSGNTAVVVSSVMPAIGTNTNVKTTQCFCDFRNTVNAFLPANGNEVYRCAVYCQ